jgi:hypothetical protein
MTHDQIREMVRRVNPIPDPRTLEIVDVPVLTTPLERRTEMQIDDRPGTEVQADRKRRRGPLVGMAAAAVILLAGLVFVLARDNTPVAEPAPNATPINPEEMDVLLEPGAFFVDTDGDEASSIGGTFVIEGTGWSTIGAGARKVFGEDFVSLLIVEVDQVWSPACEIPAPAPVAAGTTAEALANQFAANGFTITDALAPVSAFGHDGHHLVAEMPAGCTGDEVFVWQGPTFGRFYQRPGQIVEYWFLDVEGTAVMVEASWFPFSQEEDVAELRAVLDTLVITP